MDEDRASRTAIHIRVYEINPETMAQREVRQVSMGYDRDQPILEAAPLHWPACVCRPDCRVTT